MISASMLKLFFTKKNRERLHTELAKPCYPSTMKGLKKKLSFVGLESTLFLTKFSFF